jgi:glycerophosphoryl diester phosphodiesterase
MEKSTKDSLPSRLTRYLSPLIVEKGFSYLWLLEKPIAHRGSHDDKIPENSLGAFKRSIELGLPIELDVHLLKDNKVVVFHDEELERLTGVKGMISHCDSKMIKDFRLLGTDEPVPLLSDVLDLVNDQVPIILEIKNTDYDGRLEDCVCDLLKNYNGRVAIQSFNPLSLIHCRKKAPERPRGILTAAEYDDLPFYKRWVLNSYLLLPRVKPSYIAHECASLDFLSLKTFRKLELIPIIAWTIRSESDLDFAQQRCQNVIFENLTYPFR